MFGFEKKADISQNYISAGSFFMEFTGVIAGNLKELQTVSFSPDISRNVAKREKHV